MGFDVLLETVDRETKMFDAPTEHRWWQWGQKLTHTRHTFFAMLYFEEETKPAINVPNQIMLLKANT